MEWMWFNNLLVIITAIIALDLIIKETVIKAIIITVAVVGGFSRQIRIYTT